MDKGLIHLYCGEGKGKTTAALGLVLRAQGAGYQVVVVQFFKGRETSERHSLKSLKGVSIVNGTLPECFTWDLSTESKEILKKEHGRMFDRAVAMIDPSRKTLLVLDEMVSAITYDYIDRDPVLAFLHTKPDSVEVVLTGRNPIPELVELADYVSDVHKVKHPYDKGIDAREGIEY